jgi:pimeloyl-ACP methyl ester carboxylesterase
LIPLLADRSRVIAPDLPGFGFTEIPEQRHYKYMGALLMDARKERAPIITIAGDVETRLMDRFV